MNCKHSWRRPALLAAVLLCGASLGVHRTQAAPSANLDQTRNGKFDAPENPVGIDVNGNAGFQNSHYLEGHAIPYRCVMSDLPANTQVTIRLGFDIKHSGRNAIDYLTGFQLLDPHNQFGHPPEEVNPTEGTSLFEEPPTPDSELTIATPNATIPANSFANLPTQTLRDASKRKMSLWGGTLNTIKYVDDSNSWNTKLAQSISQIQIDVTFTTGSGGVAILSWAGHIASRADWGFDANGIPNSAGGISGSPYHMALISWSLSNIGQQDRSLKADAVIIPPTCDVTGDSKCVGQTATLIVTPHTQVGGFGEPYTFKWSKTLNPDGSLGTIISMLPTLSITNAQLSDAGTYYAKVFDKSGISSLGCNGALAVNPTPTAAAGDDQRKCEDDGKSFVMAATATNGSILWDVISRSPSDLGVTFSSATAEDPTVTLSKAGTATLRLTVTSQSNPSCGNASDTVDVTVFPEPTAAAGPDQKKCEDDGKSFLMAATATNGSILWTVDSKNPSDLVVTFSSATAEDPTVTLSKVGTATLRMTVTSQSNPSCGTASAVVAVTVFPEPTAAAGPDQKKCEDDGKSFLMAATATNGSILWTVDSRSPADLGVTFSSATAEDPTVTLSKVGTATLRMTVTSQSNPSCGSASALITVTVFPEPIAVAGPGQAKCAGEPNGKVFTMAATASNGSILWTVDSKSPSDLTVNFSSATAEDPTVTLSKAGTATLRLTVTSQSNPSCGSATDTVAVTVNDISVAPLGNPVTCNAANGGGIATVKATPTATSATKSFGWLVGVATSPGSPTFDFYSKGDVVTGLTFTENLTTGALTVTINTLTYKGGLAAGQYQIRAVATDPATTCVSVAATGILTVNGPAIACGPECAGGTAPLLVHRLDADTQGGAAIVDDSAVALDTFPSGSDISYEPFDKFAALGLAPGQETTTQIEIPICNKGNVPLENVRLTFYKGNTALEQNPTDSVTVPDGALFDGTLGVGQNVTLLCAIQVQCGTVPITVSGTSSDANGACTVDSSCSVEVDCIEVFCRTTGGGRQDPSATTHLQVRSGSSLVDDTSVKFTTHGGQMRGRQTIPHSAADINLSNGSTNICGQWQHVRHANNGRLQSFHTGGIFDSLRCACLACDSLTPLPNGEVCNPEDRVCGPEPRRANANAIAVTGVGKMALKPGQKDTDVVFRIYVEDRGEPGGSPFGHPEDPPDVYCIQVWIVNNLSTSGTLRATISGWLGTGVPVGAPVPDISDCGDLSRGNHQLHPVKNLNCQ